MCHSLYRLTVKDIRRRVKTTVEEGNTKLNLKVLCMVCSLSTAGAAFPDTHTVVGPERVKSFPTLLVVVLSRSLLFREFYCVRYTSLRVWQRTLTWYELFKWWCQTTTPFVVESSVLIKGGVANEGEVSWNWVSQTFRFFRRMIGCYL